MYTYASLFFTIRLLQNQIKTVHFSIFLSKYLVKVIPSSVKFSIAHCGTNNLDYDDPNCIAKGILNIGKSLLNNNFYRCPST